MTVDDRMDKLFRTLGIDGSHDVLLHRDTSLLE